MTKHKPELDSLTPSEIRVVLEQMLWTMEIKQRENLQKAYPGLYKAIYPDNCRALTGGQLEIRASREAENR